MLEAQVVQEIGLPVADVPVEGLDPLECTAIEEVLVWGDKRA